MKKILLLLLSLFLIENSFAKTWKVGPAKTYTKPSQVSSMVQDGDTVEIDAGTYASDVAKWSANNLLLKGVGGMAHLPANGSSFGGKAIWVIAGNNTRVEYIEFSLCTVVDKNGAGIRLEGKNLTVSHCYFHNNENGILAGKINPCTLLVEYTEFGNNGAGDGYSHNLYIGNIDTLKFQYNYSHHALVGHELKSRANVNIILYNRLSDETTGTASRNIDLPNGGTAYIIGNIIEQGPQTQNSNIVGYGLEGLTNTAPHNIYAINNTLVNNRTNGGSFFSFQSGTALFKGYNNILAGPGSFVSGSFPTATDTAGNRVSANINSFNFTNPSIYDYHISGSSTSAVNLGKNPGSVNSFSLSPVKEYMHSNNQNARCSSGALDIGAYEYCTVSINYPKSIFLTIYPNPSSGKFRIETGRFFSGRLTVFNQIGEVVFDSEISGSKTEIDTNLKSGVYFYEVFDKHLTSSKGKLIIE